MYTLNISGYDFYSEPEFLPGFLGVLVFSLFFFWLLGIPLKNKKKQHFENYPLDILNVEQPKRQQKILISSNDSKSQLSKRNRYVIYGLSLLLCFIPMSELLDPLFY